MSKKSHRIALDVKNQILKRVKEEGIPVSQAAKEHGVSDVTIYSWLTKGATGNPSWSEFARIQKQNKELLEIIGELTVRLSASQKKN